jgi:endonuclease-3
LFRRARTPQSMAKLSVAEIGELIYPVGFYRTKAKHVKACCEALVRDHRGRVPQTMEELTALPGVGRKTANLVMIVAFKSRANICVDTHVHRIANRLGWVQTSSPQETEEALYARTDRRWWSLMNLYLVTWGQNVCRPIGPRCDDCAIARHCPRIGVAHAGAPEPRRTSGGIP